MIVIFDKLITHDSAYNQSVVSYWKLKVCQSLVIKIRQGLTPSEGLNRINPPKYY